jgi:hypothetical protein
VLLGVPHTHGRAKKVIQIKQAQSWYSWDMNVTVGHLFHCNSDKCSAKSPQILIGGSGSSSKWSALGARPNGYTFVSSGHFLPAHDHLLTLHQTSHRFIERRVRPHQPASGCICLLI